MHLRAPMPLVVAAIALATAGLVALGVWQVQRHEWKQDLVAERNARTASAPAAAADLAAGPPEDTDYRRVEAAGTWDVDHAMILGNRGRSAVKGEEVIVPLLLSPDGPALLVNRGWYPEAARDEVFAGLRADASGEARTAGLARALDGRGSRTPAGTWNGFNPGAMADGLPYRVLPWVLVEGEMVERLGIGDGSVPVRGYEPYRSTTPHLAYAVTWFGLAAALVGVAVVRFAVMPRRSERRAPPVRQPR